MKLTQLPLTVLRQKNNSTSFEMIKPELQQFQDEDYASVMKLAVAAQRESIIEYSNNKPRAENIININQQETKMLAEGKEENQQNKKGFLGKRASTRVQLFISAKGLTDLDVFSLSDPFCTLKIKNYQHGSYVAYGSTEVIENNLNPKWVKNFTIDWYEDGVQWLLFEVWDEDDDTEHELIGKTELQLSTIMQAPKQEFCCALTQKKQLRGTIKIKADCVIVSDDTIKLHLNGDL